MPKSMTCGWCNERMAVSRTSRPEGQACCNPCRQMLRAEGVSWNELVGVAASPKPPTRRASPVQPKPRGTTTERGYGAYHQRMRRYLLATFEDGQACARCGFPMRVGETMDLDHTDDRTDYLGLSHASCNRSHGAPRLLRKFPWTSCPICGGEKRSDTATCGRACGWEWRRRRAA